RTRCPWPGLSPWELTWTPLSIHTASLPTFRDMPMVFHRSRRSFRLTGCEVAVDRSAFMDSCEAISRDRDTVGLFSVAALQFRAAATPTWIVAPKCPPDIVVRAVSVVTDRTRSGP